eukprot:CAMPEP_0115018916 /NCGR_PEP_ID=MMETSP0216-20121206/29121_1 /TAXON_ID=223996 /ORGANISM="Protocruzia adherens, Strain Boccale" /LENGTH=47 /DNA_ID= /DNA_START= /DNA_END= /DNA_ORIENTATION=
MIFSTIVYNGYPPLLKARSDDRCVNITFRAGQVGQSGNHSSGDGGNG